MSGRGMGKMQWAILAAVALVAASWSNGLSSAYHLIAAGIIGALIGWLLASRVTR